MIRTIVVIGSFAFLSACTHTYSGYALDGSLSCAERVVAEMGYDVMWSDSTRFTASRWGSEYVRKRLVVRLDSSSESGARISVKSEGHPREAEIIIYQCAL
jgi:hypothetical protein